MRRRAPFPASWLALILAVLGCGDPSGRQLQSPEGTVDTLASDADTGSASQDGTEDVDTAAAPAVLTGAEEDPDAWSSGVVSVSSAVAGGMPLLTAVRSGRHESFERVVLELSDGEEGIPGYHVEYVDRPLHECGSGREVQPVGDGWLEIRVEPLDAHTEAGEPTVSHRPVDLPGLQNLRRLYMTCDFEGVVTLVVAMASPNEFRAFHLERPRRLVVDVRK